MRIALIVAVAVLLSSAQLPAQAPSMAPAGNVENGKKLWVDRACFQCHDYQAQGGAGSGARLAGRLPAWDYFLKYIRRPTGQMIPYTAKVLPDQEAADIYAWIKSLPPPPPVSSIPELK
jgi:mono/diheme cytochrome c family protein